ncbi:MAG: hypothetical protein J0L66_17585 [Cytophagales bacterium]|nr:hypothetical protein [Cytophagales bacterium]
MKIHRVVELEFKKLPRRFYFLLLVLSSVYYFINLYSTYFINSLDIDPSPFIISVQFPRDSIKAINLLFPIWVIIGIAYEFENKIIQRSISYGASINDFFIGKVIFILLIIMYFELLSLSGFLITANHYSVTFDFVFLLGFLVHLFVYLLAYGFFCFFLTVIFRRGVSALVIFFIYSFVEITFGLYLIRKYSVDLSFLPMHILKNFNSVQDNGIVLFYLSHDYYNLTLFLLLLIGLFLGSLVILKRKSLDPL